MSGNPYGLDDPRKVKAAGELLPLLLMIPVGLVLGLIIALFGG